eukprot:UN24373
MKETFTSSPQYKRIFSFLKIKTGKIRLKTIFYERVQRNFAISKRPFGGCNLFEKRWFGLKILNQKVFFVKNTEEYWSNFSN